MNTFLRRTVEEEVRSAVDWPMSPSFSLTISGLMAVPYFRAMLSKTIMDPNEFVKLAAEEAKQKASNEGEECRPVAHMKLTPYWTVRPDVPRGPKDENRHAGFRTGIHPFPEIARDADAEARFRMVLRARLGFSMPGNGLRQTLCLADINPAAVASCKIQREQITSPSASQSTCRTISRKFPRSEMWDLVVSNPSHFVDQYEGDSRDHDPDWRIDRGFCASISGHLT